MSYTEGLDIREIFHFRYGICQMVLFSRDKCWLGLNEKKQALWAPDKYGHPDMDRVKKTQYLYEEHLPYLEVLNPDFIPECKVLEYTRMQKSEIA